MSMKEIKLEDIKAKQEELQQMIKQFEESKKIDSEWIAEEGNMEHFYVNSCGKCDESGYVNDEQINNLNAFKTESKAEEIAFKQLLFRKLQKWYNENDGKVDWTDKSEYKYCIEYNYESQYVEHRRTVCYRSSNIVYFSSEKLIKKAIELFEDDLIKYFTKY